MGVVANVDVAGPVRFRAVVVRLLTECEVNPPRQGEISMTLTKMSMVILSIVLVYAYM